MRTRQGGVKKMPMPSLFNSLHAAHYCGFTIRAWCRYEKKGCNPAPIIIDGDWWYSRKELRRWMDAGCPPRRIWEAEKKLSVMQKELQNAAKILKTMEILKTSETLSPSSLSDIKEIEDQLKNNDTVEIVTTP